MISTSETGFELRVDRVGAVPAPTFGTRVDGALNAVVFVGANRFVFLFSKQSHSIFRLGDVPQDLSARATDDSLRAAVASIHGVHLLQRTGHDTWNMNFRQHPVAITSVVLGASDVPLVVAGDECGSVMVYRGDDLKVFAHLNVHRKATTIVDILTLRNATLVLSGSDDRQVVVTDIEGHEQFRSDRHAGWVEQARLVNHPTEGQQVVVLDRIGLTVWDLASGDALHRVRCRAIDTLWVGSDESVALVGERFLTYWRGTKSLIIRTPNAATRLAGVRPDGYNPTFILAEGHNVWLATEFGSHVVKTFTAPIGGVFPSREGKDTWLWTTDGQVWSAQW